MDVEGSRNSRIWVGLRQLKLVMAIFSGKARKLRRPPALNGLQLQHLRLDVEQSR